MDTEIKESELAMRGWTPRQFQTMPLQYQRWIGAGIMRSRPDPESQRRAFLMELANPNFTYFQVLVGQ